MKCSQHIQHESCHNGSYMNVYYVKSLLTINKVTLQPYIDTPAKIDSNLILLFQILKRCLVIFTLLSLIFLLFLAIGDTQISEGSQIDSLTTSYGFRQLISEPSHILKNSSSCIDLIFTDQPSLIIDSGTHPSLHPNCHHKIIHCKIDLEIIYPHLI